jgi:hypothetical protein
MYKALRAAASQSFICFFANILENSLAFMGSWGVHAKSKLQSWIRMEFYGVHLILHLKHMAQPPPFYHSFVRSLMVVALSSGKFPIVSIISVTAEDPQAPITAIPAFQNPFG